MFTKLTRPGLCLHALLAIAMITSAESAMSNNCGSDDEPLDVDFTDPDIWGGADRQKTYRPPNGNVLVTGSPKLGQSVDFGLGASNDALDGPAERLAIGTYWAPEVLSGICISNISSDNPGDAVGYVTLTVVETNGGNIVYGRDGCSNGVSNGDDLPCTAIEGPFDIYADQDPQNEVELKFDPPLLVTDAVFTTSGSKVGYSVAGLRLSKEVTVKCSAPSENCESPVENPEESPVAEIFRTGEFNARVTNLKEGSDFIARMKLNQIVNFVDPREECSDPGFRAEDCATPRGLLLDFSLKEATPLCDFSDEDDAQLSHQTYLSADYCGAVVYNKGGSGNNNGGSDTERIIRAADIDSSYLGYGDELIQSFIDPVLHGPDGLPTCEVKEDDLAITWLPKKGKEVPVYKAGKRLASMIDVTAGCGSYRTYTRHSWLAWNLERSPSNDPARIFQDTTEVISAALEQSGKCTTNGEATSALSSHMGKIKRYFSRDDYPRTAAEIASFLEKANEAGTVDAMIRCDWDLKVDDELNPQLDLPISPGVESAGYTGLFNGLGLALQYQICSQFTGTDSGAGRTWVDPELNGICQSFLSCSDNADSPACP